VSEGAAGEQQLLSSLTTPPSLDTFTFPNIIIIIIISNNLQPFSSLFFTFLGKKNLEAHPTVVHTQYPNPQPSTPSLQHYHQSIQSPFIINHHHHHHHQS
jgi:hypothetical protein